MTHTHSARRKKIAFIRMGDFPYANQSMVHVLQESFPEFTVETLDIAPLIKRRIDIIFINALFVLTEYGLKLLFGYRNLWESFFTTTYMFKKIKQLVGSHFAHSDLSFSFQMQSLFDASMPNTRHFVYTDHTCLVNLTYPGFRTAQLPSRAYLKLEASIYQNAAATFVRSTNVARSLHDQYGCGPDRVKCIYVGPNFRVDASSEFIPAYDRKNILFVGVDWERKGGPELVEAFRAVRDKFPDARLTIVGCSPRIDMPGCEVAGKVHLADVHRYFEQASIFCLPTRLEPFGVVFVEALHHKLPIVATNIGAIPDFVIEDESGYLVPPRAIDSLAQALISLIGDPEKCCRFGEKGFRLARERYSWENVGARITETVNSYL